VITATEPGSSAPDRCISAVSDRRSERKEALPVRRPRERGVAETIAACRRYVRAAGRRIAHGDHADITDLAELDRVHEEIDRAWCEAALAAMARFGYAQSDIARAMGVTRQAVASRLATHAARTGARSV
jgi:hypothetical protein